MREFEIYGEKLKLKFYLIQGKWWMDLFQQNTLIW